MPGPYRILEVGASLGVPERPGMRDTLLFSIKKDARSAKIQLARRPPRAQAQPERLRPGLGQPDYESVLY